MAKSKKKNGRLRILLLALSLLALPAIAGGPALAAPPDVIVDDFESGLPSGADADGISIGFYTFEGAGTSVALSTTATPPAPSPGAGTSVLQLDVETTSFAGVIHGFENATVDTWVPQDWSLKEGIAFWLYGNNSGTDLFIDILENRNPGSTTDDAERWSVAFVDDFSGWQLVEFPFSNFVRKGIGNGAPNDGFDRFEVHGWALGALGTGGPRVYYVDDVGLYGEVEPPALSVGFAATSYDVDEGSTTDIAVKLNRPMNADDPDLVSVDYTIDPGTLIPGREYTPVAGTLTFVNGGSGELTFPFETFDDGKYEPTERAILRLSNAVDVELGTAQAAATVVDNDPFDPRLLDDFEAFPYLWNSTSNVELGNQEIAAGGPYAVPGQGAYEGVLAASVPLNVDIDIEGRLCNRGNGVVAVNLLSTANFDATTVDHTTVTLGDATETHVNKKTGVARRHVEDVNRDGLKDLVFHFRFDETGLACDPDFVPFNGSTFGGQPITAGGSDARFGRDYAIGQDWSGTDGISFWYYGQNSGDEIGVELLDNRAADPGPAGWDLVWSDEFDAPAGTPPNSAYWDYEIGDGVVNGIPGWGNSELQYYTDSTDNVATDGEGNLVITAREATGELCYYGECGYTSARLLTKNRAEFAYGRIESRILVPDGAAGLWPAFWSLGTDIDLVGWPQTGEIDIMEYVSRQPNEIFGTIHGPGYSGGNAFGDFFYFEEEAPPGPGLVITFDEPGLAFFGFGGADDASVAADPSDPSNNVMRVVKADGSEFWAGTIVGTDVDAGDIPVVPAIPFSDSNKTVTVRVWSPDAGIPVRLKVENAVDNTISVETEATTTVADAWETLVFDFANNVPGTPALDLTATYDRTVIFFDFGTAGSGKTYYADDITFPAPTVVPIPVSDDYHTFTIEWEPDLINWSVDGVLYHTATPDSVAPNEWVFNDPVFLLLNLALGGNFGGPLSEDLTFPQEMKVDYVRVFQGPDTAERWETTFVDDFSGWMQVDLPFGLFTRSAEQPAGAPDDGLGLSEVWGYGLRPDAGTPSGTMMLDQVRLLDEMPPVVVITDDVEEDTATGDVTFSFTFSEDVGTSFTVDDIALTGGTKGAFTRLDGKQATLVARPPADSQGTLVVTVPVGAFVDLGGNPNQEEASAEQAYDTPPLAGGGLVITFDEPGLAFLGFGGAEDASVVVDPTDPSNNVMRVVKNPPEVWAGTIVGTETDAGGVPVVPVIPFSESNKTVTVRVWSPDPGIPVRLKVENSIDNGIFVETEALTTVAGAWETLAFDFGNDLGVPLNLAAVYDRVVIFFDFGTAGSGKTYYADDITYPAPPPFVITFDEPGLAFLGFGGAEDASVVVDPTDPSNNVMRVVKNPPEVWAGTIVGTETDAGGVPVVPVIPFSESNKTVTVRVWSPDPGIPVRLKVENSIDNGIFVETEALTTVAGAWETLAFDFGNDLGVPLNLAAVYDRVVIFFDFGTAGSGKTYYADDITYPSGGGLIP